MCNAGLLHNKMEPRRADFIFIFNYYPCRFFLQIQSLHFLLSLSILAYRMIQKQNAYFTPAMA